MIAEMLKNLRNTAPLIHCITNYVTVNDCANILLACGASPIMSDDSEEVEEITGLCSGLVINIGTLNQNTIPGMFLAGKKASELKHPIVLDPVGAGASALRTKTAKRLMECISFTVIRGNSSELKALATGSATTKGVDADAADWITEEGLEQTVCFAKQLSRVTGSVIAITGAIDVVSDKDRAFCIRNGHPLMSSVTGTGCQLSAMTAAFAAANPSNPLEAAAASVCAMGLCGEKAYERMTVLDGNASYRNYLIDAICHLTPEELKKGAKYEVR